MMALPLALCLPFITAYLLIAIALPGIPDAPHWALVCLRIALASGLALALSSCTLFLWLVWFGAPDHNFIVTESSVLGIVSFVLYHHLALRPRVYRGLSSQSYPFLYWILLSCFAIALIASVIRFIFLSVNDPHGGVDALGIWNLRARFLFAGGSEVKELLGWVLAKSSTPDYPLLLPASIARLWGYMGEDSPLAPVIVAFIFTFGIVGLGLAAITILRTPVQGLLAGLVLVGTSFLIKHGASQYGDIPFAFFMLATLVLLSLSDELDANASLLTLTGAVAGFAVWTKNEGALLLLAVIFVRLVTVAGRDRLHQMIAFAGGLLPVLAIVLYFKARIAPAQTLIVAQGGKAIIEKLKAPSSYWEVGAAVAQRIFRVGHPGLVLPAIYGVLVGFSTVPKNRTSIATCTLVLS